MRRQIPNNYWSCFSGGCWWSELKCPPSEFNYCNMFSLKNTLQAPRLPARHQHLHLKALVFRSARIKQKQTLPQERLLSSRCTNKNLWLCAAAARVLSSPWSAPSWQLFVLRFVVGLKKWETWAHSGLFQAVYSPGRIEGLILSLMGTFKVHCFGVRHDSWPVMQHKYVTCLWAERQWC